MKYIIMIIISSAIIGYGSNWVVGLGIGMFGYTMFYFIGDMTSKIQMGTVMSHNSIISGEKNKLKFIEE